MKLVCCADLHLGRKSTLPEDLKNKQDDFSSEKAWNRIIDIAIYEKADAILVAGDVFDKNVYQFTSKKLLEESLKKLKNKNIEVLMISGNHDSKLLESVVKNIKLSADYDFLKIIGCGCKWESYDLKGLSILGFGLDKNDYKKNPFNEKSLKKIELKDKYILMLHGDYTSNEGKYAPFRESLSSDQVQNSIITLIGHTHKYEDKDKYISLGSPQANDFGEKGPHGVLILDLDDNFNIETREYRQISNIYYDQVDIKVEEDDELSILLNKKLNTKAEAEMTYYRVNLVGRISKEKHENIKVQIEDLLGENNNGLISEKIYVDPDEFINNTLPDFDIDAMSKQKNAIGVIAKKIKSIDEGKFIEEYNTDFENFKEKFSDYLKQIKANDIEDKELLYYIKNSFIKFLESEKTGEK